MSSQAAASPEEIEPTGLQVRQDDTGVLLQKRADHDRVTVIFLSWPEVPDALLALTEALCAHERGRS